MATWNRPPAAAQHLAERGLAGARGTQDQCRALRTLHTPRHGVPCVVSSTRQENTARPPEPPEKAAHTTGKTTRTSPTPSCASKPPLQGLHHRHQECAANGSSHDQPAATGLAASIAPARNTTNISPNTSSDPSTTPRKSDPDVPAPSSIPGTGSIDNCPTTGIDNACSSSLTVLIRRSPLSVLISQATPIPQPRATRPMTPTRRADGRPPIRP